MDSLIKKATDKYLNRNIARFGIGDTVKLHLKIIEGDSERTQAVDGQVIARSGKGTSETFTIRRVSYGVGMEMTFPVNSPRLEKIEVKEEGKVRRAKLYYLRNE